MENKEPPSTEDYQSANFVIELIFLQETPKELETFSEEMDEVFKEDKDYSLFSKFERDVIQENFYKQFNILTD